MWKERFYYQSDVIPFLTNSTDTILGKIIRQDDYASLQLTQRKAWEEEIAILKHTLRGFDEGLIVFEYSIPRLGKRIDAVLLLRGIVFVLEFKVGESHFLRQDIDQVWDYALDLKNFHEESHDKTIVPLLIATEASDKYISSTTSFCLYDDQVYEPICTNKAYLLYFIENTLEKAKKNDQYRCSRWLYSRYSPTPTIIEAASYLFNNHSVENITRSDATETS